MELPITEQVEESFEEEEIPWSVPPLLPAKQQEQSSTSKKRQRTLVIDLESDRWWEESEDAWSLSPPKKKQRRHRRAPASPPPSPSLSSSITNQSSSFIEDVPVLEIFQHSGALDDLSFYTYYTNGETDWVPLHFHVYEYEDEVWTSTALESYLNSSRGALIRGFIKRKIARMEEDISRRLKRAEGLV